MKNRVTYSPEYLGDMSERLRKVLDKRVGTVVGFGSHTDRNNRNLIAVKWDDVNDVVTPSSYPRWMLTALEDNAE